MLKILVLRNKATIWSPHGNYYYAQALRASARGVAAARSPQFRHSLRVYKQYLAQRRKQKETLRDRQRDRSKRSRPKRERQQAERRDAAAAQKAAKATAAKAAVVDAARQRAAAEQRLAALKQRACA